jgi:hypothetical protein
LVTSALIRAPGLQNAEIQIYFSRQRIYVNLAPSKWIFDKRFEILRKLATTFWDRFLKLGVSLVYIRLESWSKNAKFDLKTFFCQTYAGFVG